MTIPALDDALAHLRDYRLVVERRGHDGGRTERNLTDIDATVAALCAPDPRFWLELREPRCVPERKGPWPRADLARVLREFMDARPRAFITVVTWGDEGPAFYDAPECLSVCDGRSKARARRHIASSTAAHAAAERPAR